MYRFSAVLGRTFVALSISAAIVISPAAFAASGGGSGGGSSGTVQCRKGLVYDKHKQICVPAHSMNDRQLYEAGRDLALAGRYEEALALLQAVGDTRDSMVLTMIGYAERKMGRVDEGMANYHRALAIDPGNVNTREYLGEGYVLIGRKDLALDQLARIERLCGVDCEQYVDLASAIAGRSEEWTPALD
jgi:tetratricopeptide (TPR) repeat protein